MSERDDRIEVTRDEAIDLAATLFEAARHAEASDQFALMADCDRLHNLLTDRLWPDLPTT